MAIKVYNTLSRQIEDFVPMNGNDVKMFVCGQTVYDDAHIGHAKVYINFDVIASWLRKSGFNLKYVQNITDVEDKIIARAAESGTTPEELARHFEERFMEDMSALNVKRNVDAYMRSSDYIDPVRQQIQLLIDNGYAYVLDGDVYYDVARFANYTKLSGMKLDELVRHRIEPKEGKRNQYDFALWKASKPGEPSWSIKLIIGGKEREFSGRPGWHIEDTAMTYSVFGPQYDVHGGALELLFPHHSNEIAQAEAAFGKKPFVKYWMHVGVLTVNGVKMSKSLKNFIRIRDVLEEYDAEVLRLLFSMSHYRKEVDFTPDLLSSSKKQLNDMYSSLSVLSHAAESEESQGVVEKIVKEMSAGFGEAMDYDFNTPEAMSHLISGLNSIKKAIKDGTPITSAEKGAALSSILGMGSVIGIFSRESYKKGLSSEEKDLIAAREKLRKNGDYIQSDRMRDELENRYGISIEDTQYGTVWYHRDLI